MIIEPLHSCLLREEYTPDLQNSMVPGTFRMPAAPQVIRNRNRILTFST
jgi:hypothetical protein